MGNMNVEKIMQDQQKYARAIKSIIPTWQGIESTGIAMCPVVAKSNGSSGSLKCRVAGFVEKAVMPSWMGSMVSTLVTGCPAATGNATECPTTSQSAGIKDLLSKNAEWMGWVIAIAVALLGATGLGAVGVKKLAKGDDEDDDEEDS